MKYITLNPAPYLHNYEPHLRSFKSKLGGRTVKCPICGDPYKFYMHSAADQSACPKCVRKAEENR